MANIYNFSRNALLKRIGLSPGKKLLVFLLSLVVITIPIGNGYNSISVIFFVLLSVLAVRRQDVSFKPMLIWPVLLFLLMLLSVSWSIDRVASIKALGKEASLIFIPVAFFLNRRLGRRSVDDILKNYSIAMCLFALYCLIRAIVRYTATGNQDVLFYHELAGEGLNAVYLSVLFSIALFEFLSKRRKTITGNVSTLFLLVMVFMLSSKNIIVIDVILIICYYLFFSGLSKKAMFTAIGVFCLLVAGLGYYGKIYDRMLHETQQEDIAQTIGVHNVTIGEAWHNNKFSPNHYFNGTAFRTYQVRIFKEMLHEDPIFFTGYGLNASGRKIEEKGHEHNLFHGNEDNIGYNKLNFHNQYVEAFADLGFFGFLIIFIAVVINLRNGIKQKYFVHIAFAVLMISLFLTETFLWRQRGVVFFTVFYCLFNDLHPRRALTITGMPEKEIA
jgi:O-antigen ligase